MKQSACFIEPTPKPWLMNLLAPVSELVLLKGLPVLRDLPFLRNFPGIRGLAKVPEIDFPVRDQQQLKKLQGQNAATFFLPNHPEFFTDWMIDKYVLSRIAPRAACWASGSIVNGMGSLMQRFWLSNNLIAQVPGQSHKAKHYSINSALKGEGVLLHPEGKVNWFSNTISPMFSGAGEMSINAHKKAVASNAEFQTWLAPMIWKLRFKSDVSSKLLDECQYIEKRLQLQSTDSACPARRSYEIYHQLACRDYFEISDADDSFADMHLSELRHIIIDKICAQLADFFSCTGKTQYIVIKTAKNWLQQNNQQHARFKTISQACMLYQRWMNLNECAFVESSITQEEIAEHLKRIRASFCVKSFRDKLANLVPQAAGNRSAHIRVVKPVPIHDLLVNNDKLDPCTIMAKVRQSMQDKLNQLVFELEQKSPSLKVSNPFYSNASAVDIEQFNNRSGGCLTI